MRMYESLFPAVFKMAAEAVRRWLATRKINIQNEWLEACINFVRDDNQGRQLSVTELNDLVYEQWLMADIQVSTNPCLPEGLCNSENSKLDGLFCLQVNSIINVGQSAYSQIQRSKGQDDPEDLNHKKNPSEPRVKPSRMLLLELTDGVQNLFGMEYQIIPALKVTTPPGTKIAVYGQVVCRLGTLLLTAKNVQIFGGSVVQLVEENSFWNVLHHAIGQEPAENPGLIKSEPLGSEDFTENQMDIEMEDKVFCPVNNQRLLVKTAVRTQNVASVPMINLNRIDNAGNLAMQGRDISQANSIVKSHKSWNHNISNQNIVDIECDEDLTGLIPDDDYFGLDEDFDEDQLNQLEEEMQQNGTRPVTNNMFVNQSDEDFEILNDDEMFDEAFTTEMLHTEQSGPYECVNFFEVKPLRERICSKEKTCTANNSKKPRLLHSSKDVTTTNSESGQQGKNVSLISLMEQDSSRNQRNFGCPSTSKSVTLEPMTSTNQDTSTSSHLAHIKAELTSQPNDSGGRCVSSGNAIIKREANSNVYDNHQPTAVCQSNLKYKIVDDSGKPQLSTAYGVPESDSVPFAYLSQVTRNRPIDEEIVVRVKAYIATLVSHSQSLSPNWTVTVKLNDGSDTVDADLSEKVLTELLGFPLEEFQHEMLEIKRNRDLASCRKLQKKTDVFQRNLASTSCVMSLCFSPNTCRPRVVQLMQPTAIDVSTLLRRVTTKLTCNQHF